MSQARLLRFKISLLLVAALAALDAVTALVVSPFYASGIDHSLRAEVYRTLVQTATEPSVLHRSILRWVEALLNLVGCGLIAAVALRALHRPEARALAVFLALLVAPLNLVALLGADPGLIRQLAFVQLVLLAVAFLRFAQVFPRGSAAAPGQKMVGSLIGAGLAAVLLLSIPPQRDLLFHLALLAAFCFVLVILVHGVRWLRRNYAVADLADRRRLLWAVQGFRAALWLCLVSFVFAPAVIGLLERSFMAGWRQAEAPPGTAPIAWDPLAMTSWQMAVLEGLSVLPIVLIVAGLAVAVFYDGGLDPGLIIRRTSMYGVLGVALTFLFAGVENIFAAYVVSALGLPGNFAAAFAGGTVALSLGPLRRWLTARLERVLLDPWEKSANGLELDAVGSAT